MGKVIRTVFKIDTLSLHECTDGYFLYDYIVGQNITMRAKSEQDAYIEALLWYQKRLKESREKFNEIHNKVYSFIEQFDREDD